MTSHRKIILFIFWDTQGLIYENYLSRGESINADQYNDMFMHLSKAIKQKLLGLLLTWICTYVNSWRVAENGQIPNIRLHSRAFLHKLMSNCEKRFAHVVFANIRQVEVLRMYLTYNATYRESTNTLIHT